MRHWISGYDFSLFILIQVCDKWLLARMQEGKLALVWLLLARAFLCRSSTRICLLLWQAFDLEIRYCRSGLNMCSSIGSSIYTIVFLFYIKTMPAWKNFFLLHRHSTLLKTWSEYFTSQPCLANVLAPKHSLHSTQAPFQGGGIFSFDRVRRLCNQWYVSREFYQLFCDIFQLAWRASFESKFGQLISF